jgi:hypothetical protein
MRLKQGLFDQQAVIGAFRLPSQVVLAIIAGLFFQDSGIAQPSGAPVRIGQSAGQRFDAAGVYASRVWCGSVPSAWGFQTSGFRLGGLSAATWTIGSPGCYGGFGTCFAPPQVGSQWAMGSWAVDPRFAWNAGWAPYGTGGFYPGWNGYGCYPNPFWSGLCPVVVPYSGLAYTWSPYAQVATSGLPLGLPMIEIPASAWCNNWTTSPVVNTQLSAIVHPVAVASNNTPLTDPRLLNLLAPALKNKVRGPGPMGVPGPAPDVPPPPQPDPGLAPDAPLNAAEVDDDALILVGRHKTVRDPAR